MYSDCIVFSDFSGCTYYYVNNPNLGIFENNIGNATPHVMATCRLNGKKNVSLNSNCFDNQEVAVIASQHNNILVGEVQPHHQCPYFNHNKGSQSSTYTGPITWCYGFPLSTVDLNLTYNTERSNHHSALQFSLAIDHYLNKEVGLGAILGPYEVINYDRLHCSPLLTRPKDGDNRRVILNLSYPAGASLNDAVSRS